MSASTPIPPEPLRVLLAGALRPPLGAEQAGRIAAELATAPVESAQLRARVSPFTAELDVRLYGAALAELDAPALAEVVLRAAALVRTRAPFAPTAVDVEVVGRSRREGEGFGDEGGLPLEEVAAALGGGAQSAPHLLHLPADDLEERLGSRGVSA